MRFFERVHDRSIRVIYLTILLLGISYGLAISLIAVWLKERGYDKDAIGDLAIFFALGIVVMAVPSGWAIRRFGGRAVLVVGLLGFSAAVGLFPFADTYAGLATLRFLDGAFSVAVWVASETVLLSRAPRGDKAYFTSLYAIALSAGYVIGPVISWAIVAVASKTASFFGAGILAIVTAGVVIVFLDSKAARTGGEPDVPLARGTPRDEPPAPAPAQLGAGAVLWRIKMSCLATFSYGYFQASVVLFLPLYLKEQGLTEQQTIIMPAFFAAGMLVFCNLAARWGDRVGHLRVMRTLGAIGVVTIIGFLFVQNVVLVFATVFVAGAALASVSPVSLALQGLVVHERDLPQAGGLYNAAYALGMLIGPPIAGRLYERVDGQAMLLHFAALWTVFVILTLVFRRDDPRHATPRPIASPR